MGTYRLIGMNSILQPFRIFYSLRVTQWMIGIRGEVPLVEELATAEDVQSFVCGHVRWSDGTPGPAIELEDIDWTTVDWNFVLKMRHVAL